MKQTVYLGDFRDAFHRMGRGNNFSYEGLGILFDWLEEVDPDSELDVIGLCCDFSEMSVDEVIGHYGLEDETENMDDDDKADFVEGYLQYNTSICGEYEAENTKHFVFVNF